jgi:hypothetical protein
MENTLSPTPNSPPLTITYDGKPSPVIPRTPTQVVPPCFGVLTDSSMNVLLNEYPDVKILDGDNKVDVEIEPDVKNNTTNIQICSCSIILNCFTRNTMSKN